MGPVRAGPRSCWATARPWATVRMNTVNPSPAAPIASISAGSGTAATCSVRVRSSSSGAPSRSRRPRPTVARMPCTRADATIGVSSRMSTLPSWSQCAMPSSPTIQQPLASACSRRGVHPTTDRRGGPGTRTTVLVPSGVRRTSTGWLASRIHNVALWPATAPGRNCRVAPVPQSCGMLVRPAVTGDGPEDCLCVYSAMVIAPAYSVRRRREQGYRVIR